MAEVNFGNVEGLHDLGRQLARAVEPLQDSVDSLNRVVTKTVSDSSWSGDAAQAFRGAWNDELRQADAIGKLLTYLSRSVVDPLAGELGRAKRLYEHVMASAHEHDIPVAHPGEQIVVPPEKAEVSRQLSAAVAAAIEAADAARHRARTQLQAVMATIRPGTSDVPQIRAARGGAGGLLDAQGVLSLAEIFSTLYTLPAGVADHLAPGREALLDEWSHLMKNKPHFGGKTKLAAWAELEDDAWQRLRAAERRLDLAEKAADTLIGSRALARANLETALKSLGRQGSAPRLLKSIPVLQIGALGYGVYYDTHYRGYSMPRAVFASTVPVATGMAAGAGTTAGLAFLGPAAPALGAVADYGVSAYTDALTHDANWGPNIQKHGVAVGVGRSFADAGSAVATSHKELFTATGNTAQAFWAWARGS